MSSRLLVCILLVLDTLDIDKSMQLPRLPKWCYQRTSALRGILSKARTPKAPKLMREGERDDMLISYAGRWRHAGMEEPQIYAALKSLNSIWCEPPKDDADIKRIARSAARYAPAPEAIEVVTDGWQVRRKSSKRKSW